jgi:hypothetical protein
MAYFLQPEAGGRGGIQNYEMMKAALSFFIDTFGGQECVSDEEMQDSLTDFFALHRGEPVEVWEPYLLAALKLLGIELC